MTTQPAPEFVTWNNSDLEHTILDSISLKAPLEVIESFSSLVRSSGSSQEREAIDLLRARLTSWGVPHKLHEPMCFISIPLAAHVRVGDTTFRAKTPSMSVSTGGREISGELVYLPSATGSSVSDVFSTGVDLAGVDVRGKIVITEGMALPGKVTDVLDAGALAGIFINPGSAIHEGICTSIWGTPDLASSVRQPGVPIVAVNHEDGQRLIAAARDGSQVAVATNLDTGWRPIPVLVAEISGQATPDEYVLLHGHLDSWHVGIGDNATGNATMLELARVFWQHRDRLDRSLRIAWWSGHSHGRYAGSTWYADTFAIDLARHCVAQVNCDSPGCRWADTYDGLNVMSEAQPFVDRVIRDTTGITPHMERPHRAGDYSFNAVGLTSFYMLSSTMSEEKRKEEGYYAVGGCGGNIQWHTEDDTLEIADREYLLRDMRMYANSILRVLSAPIHPFDWRRTTAEFRGTLTRYQQAAGAAFDFTPAFEAVAALDAALARFYAATPIAIEPASAQVRRFNAVQRRLARLLIPVNFSAMPSFYHDPALHVPHLPDLAPALTFPAAGDDVAQRGILRAHLTRGQNRLVWALEQARESVEAATPA
ncbi:MAG: protease-associated domain protein [Chloroflexi bacterium]|nr:protease-associated domain protein [Chloroflexota bacterium]